MKPKIYEEWEQVLSYLEKAEKLYEVGKIQEAENEANAAIMLGLQTIAILAKELEIPDLLVIFENACHDWCERTPAFGGKHYTPKENIEWVRSTLKKLSDELPPDTLRPLK
ncbi:unnamed protein product [marine sediment metagenome]|uniref:HEPN domain-containing protein n=1 Tax=marine sediment metagenome TaxID=412755 RepID=X0V7F8_9ZZZZ